MHGRELASGPCKKEASGPLGQMRGGGGLSYLPNPASDTSLHLAPCCATPGGPYARESG